MHNPAVSSLGSEYRRDKNRRFSIPDGLIEKAAWPNGQTLELVAEAMESGRIKLHLADSIKTALEARKQELERSTAPDKETALAAFAHRYQRATYFPSSNGQVVLSTAAAFNLGIAKDASEDVLLEIAGSTIEILSRRYIAERREQYEDRTAP